MVAFSDKPPHNDHDTGPPSHSNADSNANSNARGGNANVDAQNSVESTVDASSTVRTTVEGSSQSTNVSITNPDSIRIRNVVSPDTPNSYPTSPCRIGVSAGLSLVGGAVSTGGSVEDKECTLRETARAFKELGVPQMGLYILCTQSEVILGDKKGKRPGIGADECIRRVEQFSRINSQPEAERSHAAEVEKELEVLRNDLAESQYRTSLVESQMAETRQMYERAATRRHAAEQRVVTEQFLTPAKRAALEELVKED
jgi:hypothetical protein